MELAARITDYLNRQGPLWDSDLTQRLINRKLEDMGIRDAKGYSLTACITGEAGIIEKNHSLGNRSSMIIVEPSDKLTGFYEDHGLSLLPITHPEESILKINNALCMLDKVSDVAGLINLIVKSVQLLQVGDPETDISYSHPEVPFSIFFSLCQSNTPVSDLRIAESVLHEAMHLKLTLIENYSPLIEKGTRSTYYSPWREQERPIRGVLHGMFVFRAISDYYKDLIDLIEDKQASEFLSRRLNTIAREIQDLKGFEDVDGLTLNGRKLVKRLHLAL